MQPQSPPPLFFGAGDGGSAAAAGVGVPTPVEAGCFAAAGVCPPPPPPNPPAFGFGADVAAAEDAEGFALGSGCALAVGASADDAAGAAETDAAAFAIGEAAGAPGASLTPMNTPMAKSTAIPAPAPMRRGSLLFPDASGPAPPRGLPSGEAAIPSGGANTSA